MTGFERQKPTHALVLRAREVITKIGEFAVSSSVNGHAQAAVVIRVDDRQRLPGRDPRGPTSP